MTGVFLFGVLYQESFKSLRYLGLVTTNYYFCNEINKERF